MAPPPLRMMEFTNTKLDHTASSVAQDKVARVQALGRGTCAENKLQSPVISSEASGAAPRMATTRHLQRHHQTNPTEDASGAIEPKTTTVRNKSHRMKWNLEMNMFIMRTYYEVTKLETEMTMYRQNLYIKWIEKYPKIEVSQQRLADQRRMIVTNNMIPLAVLETIKKEVMDGMQLENTEQQQIEQIVRSSTQDEPFQRQRESTRVDDEFKTAILEFVGMDPTQRHRIPRQRPSKELWHAIDQLNKYIIPSYLEGTDDAVEAVHTVIYCAAVAATRYNGKKTVPPGQQRMKGKNEQAWQRRLRNRVEELRRNIARVTQYIQGNRSKKLIRKVKVILNKARIHSKYEENQYVEEYLDTLKQSLQAISKRLRRYKVNTQRKTDNAIFVNDEKAFYRNLDGKDMKGQGPPKIEDVEEFWGNIWSKTISHNMRTPWLKKERETAKNRQEMGDWEITECNITNAINKTSNWKAPGIDNIHNYWYKKFTSTHRYLAKELTHMIRSPDRMPGFLTQSITLLKAKDKDTTNPAKYRPIACLPTLYKILTACIANKIRIHIDKQAIMAEQQKGCRKGSRGSKEQLTIDAVVMEQAFKMHRNLYTTYIDYRKAYDSVPHSWLLEVLEIYRVNPVIINFLKVAMTKWTTTIMVEKIKTGPIPIRRGIFQGDSLSPLWFCLALNPLSTLLNESKYGFNIRNNKSNLYTLSHLMYIDDIKIYATSQNQLQQLIRITEEFSNDIKMEFGIEKCKIHGVRQGKLEACNYQLKTGEEISAMEEGETYKYLGMLQAYRLEHKEIKSQLTNKYHQRLKRLIKTKLNGRNMTKAINTYATPVLTYSFGVIKWSTTEVEDIMRKTRTTLTKNRMHHPKSAIERMTIERKEGGLGLVDLIEQRDTEISNLRKYFHHSTTPLKQAVSKTDKKYTPLDLATLMTETQVRETKKEAWGRKVIHGRHYNDLQSDYVDKIASNAWLTNGALFPETEGFMMAIQDQVVSTKNYRKYIIKDTTIANDKCRRCCQVPETIQHITAGCRTLTQTDYMVRHNQVAKIIHQKLARKHRLTTVEPVPYYKYEPNTILENCTHKLYWDRTIRTDKTILHNRPDIVLVDKGKKATYLIDIAIPNTCNLQITHEEKRAKYSDLRYEITEMWHMEKVTILPIVISATGVIPKTIHNSIEKLDLPRNTYMELQKAAVLNTCRTVRRFLDN